MRRTLYVTAVLIQLISSRSAESADPTPAARQAFAVRWTGVEGTQPECFADPHKTP
jgi:hypothetical protein